MSVTFFFVRYQYCFEDLVVFFFLQNADMNRKGRFGFSFQGISRFFILFSSSLIRKSWVNFFGLVFFPFSVVGLEVHHIQSFV